MGESLGLAWPPALAGKTAKLRHSERACLRRTLMVFLKVTLKVILWCT